MTIEAICPFGDHPFSYEPKPGARRVYCSPRHQRQFLGQRQYAARVEARKSGQGERRCSRCHSVKPETDFAGAKSAYCKPCMAEYAREKRALETPEQSYTRQRKETLRRYGLTAESFAAKLAAQDGRCAICRTDDPGAAGWQVDHDHACCARAKSSCGQCLRDILCTSCNKGIGHFRDDPEIIQAAYDYVMAWRVKRLLT